jgi:hypothetical protein
VYTCHVLVLAAFFRSLSGHLCFLGSLYSSITPSLNETEIVVQICVVALIEHGPHQPIIVRGLEFRGGSKLVVEVPF